MPSKLDQFYSNVFSTGIVRPNRFEVFITPPSLGTPERPPSAALSSPTLARHLTFVCESVDIPSQNVGTVDYKVNGLIPIPIPNAFSYNNQLNMTFKLSSDYRERNMLIAWQDRIYRNGVGFSYYNEYLGTIIVRPMDTKNQVPQEFIFRNCFPITIQELQYNWGSTNENMKQGVTFSFLTMETQISSVRSSNSSIDKPFQQLFSGFPTGIDSDSAYS